MGFFPEIQNRKPNLYGFVEHEICLQELYSYQTLVENLKPVVHRLSHNRLETPFRLNHFHIDSFSTIFHGFTKHGIVHQLEEIIFKRVLCRFPLLCVQSDVLS